MAKFLPRVCGVKDMFKKCTVCHSEGGQGGLNLTSYATLMAGGTNGPVILPGDPDNSLLVKIQSGSQPHFGQLSPDELETIIAWILAGAPEE